MTDQEIHDLASCLVDKLTSDYRFRRMVRETLLFLMVEQEETRDRSAVDTFLRCCADRDISLRMRENGKIAATNMDRMTADLKAVYIAYKPQIHARLQKVRERQEAGRQRDMEQQQLHERRMSEETNLPAKNGTAQPRKGAHEQVRQNGVTTKEAVKPATGNGQSGTDHG